MDRKFILILVVLSAALWYINRQITSMRTDMVKHLDSMREEFEEKNSSMVSRIQLNTNQCIHKIKSVAKENLEQFGKITELNHQPIRKVINHFTETDDTEREADQVGLTASPGADIFHKDTHSELYMSGRSDKELDSDEEEEVNVNNVPDMNPQKVASQSDEFVNLDVGISTNDLNDNNNTNNNNVEENTQNVPYDTVLEKMDTQLKSKIDELDKILQDTSIPLYKNSETMETPVAYIEIENDDDPRNNSESSHNAPINATEVNDNKKDEPESPVTHTQVGSVEESDKSVDVEYDVYNMMYVNNGTPVVDNPQKLSGESDENDENDENGESGESGESGENGESGESGENGESSESVKHGTDSENDQQDQPSGETIDFDSIGSETSASNIASEEMKFNESINDIIDQVIQETENDDDTPNTQSGLVEGAVVNIGGKKKIATKKRRIRKIKISAKKTNGIATYPDMEESYLTLETIKETKKTASDDSSSDDSILTTDYNTITSKDLLSYADYTVTNLRKIASAKSLPVTLVDGKKRRNMRKTELYKSIQEHLEEHLEE